MRIGRPFPCNGRMLYYSLPKFFHVCMLHFHLLEANTARIAREDMCSLGKRMIRRSRACVGCVLCSEHDEGGVVSGESRSQYDWCMERGFTKEQCEITR